MSSTLPAKHKPFLLYGNAIEMYKAREKYYVVMGADVSNKHGVTACPAIINNTEEFIKLMRDNDPMIIAAVDTKNTAMSARIDADKALELTKSTTPLIVRSRTGENVKTVNIKDVVPHDGDKKINVEVIVIFDVRSEQEKIGSAVIDHAFNKVKDLFPHGKFTINLKILVSEDIRTAITAKIANLGGVGGADSHITKASAVQEVVFKSNKLDCYLTKGTYSILDDVAAKKYLQDMSIDASALPNVSRGDVMSIWLDANRDDIILYETMTPGGKVVTRKRVI